MPRARSQVAATIEQLDETRNNIKKLNETLQEVCCVFVCEKETDHHGS